jgi:hypothetical protein
VFVQEGSQIRSELKGNLPLKIFHKGVEESSGVTPQSEPSLLKKPIL